MAEKKISWSAWGWLIVLLLMFAIPVLGVLLERVAVVSASLAPTFAGIVVGAVITLIALYLRRFSWWGTTSLAIAAISMILFHRQLGQFLVGLGIGAILTFFRQPLLKIAQRLVNAWSEASRKNSAAQDETANQTSADRSASGSHAPRRPGENPKATSASETTPDRAS